MQNVLSLFDGMSCGRLALERAGIDYLNYSASEIDKHAIAVSKANSSRVIHLGDVRCISDTPSHIDLLLAGSPCQGFSFAGKQLNFDDPRSALFFEFVRILHEAKPKYFLLENVNMKQEYQDVISSYLGVKPVRINSSDFSAQDRIRLYWTNIPIPKLYNYCNHTLEDVLDREPIPEKYYISPEAMITIIENEVLKGKIKPHTIDLDKNRFYNIHGVLVGIDQAKPNLGAGLPCLTPGRLTKRQNGRRFKPAYSKFYTLTAQDIHGVLMHNRLRFLTPEEYEKLQTVPVGYTSCVSDSQRYKMLGNGWTVDVIAHILKGLK